MPIHCILFSPTLFCNIFYSFSSIPFIPFPSPFVLLSSFEYIFCTYLLYIFYMFFYILFIYLGLLPARIDQRSVTQGAFPVNSCRKAAKGSASVCLARRFCPGVLPHHRPSFAFNGRPIAHLETFLIYRQAWRTCRLSGSLCRGRAANSCCIGSIAGHDWTAPRKLLITLDLLTWQLCCLELTWARAGEPMDALPLRWVQAFRCVFNAAALGNYIVLDFCVGWWFNPVYAGLYTTRVLLMHALPALILW